MSIFSTRNSDGASSKGESANTISAKDMHEIRKRADTHLIHNEGGLFGDKARRFSAAHDQRKAGSN